MKVFYSFFLCLSFLTISNLSSYAQVSSNEEDVMIITIETIDANGNTKVKKLKFTGVEADESKVQEIVDKHITGYEKSVNVNVEIESSSDSSDDDIQMNVRDMEIKVENDKVYLDGKEVEEGEYDDKSIRIIKGELSDDELEDVLEGIDVDIDIEGSEEEHSIFIIETEEESVIEHKKRAFLGVENGGDDNGTCVVIRKVIEGTAAEKYGLHAGDKILEVDEEKMTSFMSLMKVIKSKKEGDVINLKYERDEEVKDIEIVLGPGAERERRYSWKDSNTKEIDPRNRNYFNKSNCSKTNCCDEKQDCCDKGATKINKARLGVSIEDGMGAKVIEVVANSAAQSAGLLKGDDIVKLGKETINSADDLIAKMANYAPGDKVKIQVIRSGSKKNFKALLKENKIESCCPGNDKPTKVEKRRIIIRKNNKEEVIEDDFKINIENDLAVQNFELFPNPTAGQVNFKFELENSAATDVKIVDLNGKEIFTETIDDFKGVYQKELDLSNYAEGIYLIQISQEGKSFIDKIIYSKD